MIAALAEARQEWRQFRDDPPGQRFRNHRERMKRRSRTHMAVAIALGVLLLAIGVIFLFIPGPGLPLIVFGLALIGSHSGRVSDALDRLEPRLRERGLRCTGWWCRRSLAQKAALVASVTLVATLGFLAMWRMLVAAYRL